MENRDKILGIDKKLVNLVHKITLVAMLFYTFAAPCQSMIQDVYGSHIIDFNNYISSNLSLLDEKYNDIQRTTVPNKVFKKDYKNLKDNLVENESNSFHIDADITQGIIGVSNASPLDDAADNLFKFSINQLPNVGIKTYVSYELNGINDNSGVAKSINDRQATGGYLVKQQQGWTLQKEEINVNWLRVGENKILFSIPKGADYQYSVRNVKIEFEKTTTNSILPQLVVNSSSIDFSKDNQVYLKGFVRNFKSDLKVVVENSILSVTDGAFEGFVKLTDEIKNRHFIVVKATDVSGFLGQEIISLNTLLEADKMYPIEKISDKASSFFKAKTQGKLSADNASIILGDEALMVDKELTIVKLRNIDIPPMSSGMINVTKGGAAYRFLPDGTKFNTPVKIELGYDEKLLPNGYSTNDIKTFYFNTDSKSWVAVKRDTINKKDKMIMSSTNHFTDYINGIIQTPESPQTAGFTPTMMNDIKAADPTSEMTLISPPEVSQKGDANVSYPIKIPAGRKGMQPQIGLQYSNEGGNGWLGIGWNINTPSIGIDTRWGTPLFDNKNETEIYTMNGEQLMYPKLSNSQGVFVDWMPNRHYDDSNASVVYNTAPRLRITSDQVIFTPRKQGSFAKIERLGDTPSNYHWKVTNTDGTINWYGGKDAIVENSVIRDVHDNIVHWGLYMTEDVFSNNVIYHYKNTELSGSSYTGTNLDHGKIFHVDHIGYTGFKNNEGDYWVNFRDETDRQDINIIGRLGVKQIEPYRLSTISIGLGRKEIRSYRLKYDYSKFGKSRLREITEYSGANNFRGGTPAKEFYKHTFDYYDDVKVNDTDIYFSEGVSQTICNDQIQTEPCKDSDGDGVCDENDPCPRESGPESNNGCPEKKICYTVNLPSLNEFVWENTSVSINGNPLPGSPFADFNSFASSMQLYNPTTTFVNNGSGFTMTISNTQQVYNSIAFITEKNQFNGEFITIECKEPCKDTDGDGVCDENDLCPNEEGPTSNSGCPVICMNTSFSVPSGLIYKYESNPWTFSFINSSPNCHVTTDSFYSHTIDGIEFSAITNNIFLIHGSDIDPFVSRCPTYPLTTNPDFTSRNPFYENHLVNYFTTVYSSLGISIFNLDIYSIAFSNLANNILNNNIPCGNNTSSQRFKFYSQQMMNLSFKCDTGPHRTVPSITSMSISRTQVNAHINTQIFINNSTSALGTYDLIDTAQFTQFQNDLVAVYPNTTVTISGSPATIAISSTNPNLQSIQVVPINSNVSNSYTLVPCVTGKQNNLVVAKEDWKDLKLAKEEVEYGINRWLADGHELELPIQDVKLNTIIDLANNLKDNTLTGTYMLVSEKNNFIWQNEKGETINDANLIEKFNVLYPTDALKKEYSKSNEENRIKEIENRKANQEKAKQWLNVYYKKQESIKPSNLSPSKDANNAVIAQNTNANSTSTKATIKDVTKTNSKSNYSDYFRRMRSNNAISFKGLGEEQPCPPIYNSSFLIDGFIPGFNSTAAILGSTATENFNIGGHIGLGIDLEWNNGHKLTTIGGGYSHTWDKSYSFTAMIDINGDGLEDFVFKTDPKDPHVYWKKHTVTRTYDANNQPEITHSFNYPGILITSIDGSIGDFYKSDGESSSYNLQLNAGFSAGSAIFGWDGSDNKSRNNIYFTDANGDGLTDIVNYGTVYFNRIINGSPFFEPESVRTENMIIKAEPIKTTPPDVTLENKTPNYDVVKVWEAPADGTIKIDNAITLTDTSKEAVATVEMKKKGKCYEVSFPMPKLIYRNYDIGHGSNSPYYMGVGLTKYLRSSQSATNISCSITYAFGTGLTSTFPTIFTDPSLYMSNGNISGRQNNALSYADIVNNSVENYNIHSDDFVTRNNAISSAFFSVFYVPSSNNYYNYLAYQRVFGPGCMFPVEDMVFYSGSIYTQNQNLYPLTIYQGWDSDTTVPPTCPNVLPTGNSWLAPHTDTTHSIITDISINNNSIGIYTLNNNTSFVNFQNLFQNYYPGSVVESDGNMITITVNDYNGVLNIKLSPILGNTNAHTYTFHEIPCNSKMKSEKSLKNDFADDWQSYKCNKDELEFIHKKFLAEGSDVKIKSYDNKLIDSIAKFYSLPKEKIIDEIERRIKEQKDAKIWLDDYEKNQKQENNKTITPITNLTVDKIECTATPDELCKLYGIKLDSGTPSDTRTLDKNCSGENLTVRKGDRIYFRVHAVANGNPPVDWNPKVYYTDATMQATVDANGLKPYSSDYSDGFILSQSVPVTFPGNGTATFSWDNFTVNPTDTVTYEIVSKVVTGTTNTSSNSLETVIHSWICNPNVATTVSSSVLSPITVSGTSTNGGTNITQFFFRVRSSSNIDWKAAEWKPKMICSTNQNIMATPNGSSLGTVTNNETKYPIVDYSIYKPYICGTYYKKVDISSYTSGSITLTPSIPTSVFHANDNGTVYFVVKRGGTFIGRQTITVANGAATITGNTVIPITGTGTNLEIGFYSDDSSRPVANPNNVSLLNRLLNVTTVATLTSGTTNTNINVSQVNFMHKPLSQFGPMYRQWGQFLYNPEVADNSIVDPTLNVKLLKEELLTITTAQAVTIQNTLSTNNSTFNAIQNIDPSDPNAVAAMQTSLQTLQTQMGKYPFMLANPSRENDNGTFIEKWIGYHHENYASALSYRAARLDQSFTISSPTSITQGLYETGAIGIDKITKGSSQNITAGGGANGFQASESYSLGGSSTSLSDYIDLNGDRYPDVVTKDEAQYTSRTGGLFSPVGRSVIGTMSDDVNGSWGISASGTFSKGGKSNSGSEGTMPPPDGKHHIGKPGTFAFGGDGNSTGISGNFGNGDNHTTRLWADINGDGLPDIVSKKMIGLNVYVSIDLNLGNNIFNQDNHWNNFTFASGKSTTTGGGLGFNFANGSIEAGLSLGNTNSDTQNTLMDINGDGLMDKVSSDDSNLSVDFNLGNKFVNSPTQISNVFNYYRSAETTNSGLNGTGTFAVIWPLYLIFTVIPLKIPDVSISASTGESTNRTNKTISDFDGDGYPDLIEEISPTSVIVYHSTIRRTDMLKTVHNPLGGSFTIDYKVQPIDYDNPHAKWTMSSLIVNDGYNKTNDGKDSYRKDFEYTNGRYDRRERDFYGYETVKTIDYSLDQNDDVVGVYRTSESKYHNRSYFLNGLLKESYVIKGDDVTKKFSRTQNIYEIRKLSDSDNNLMTASVLPSTFDVGGTEGRKSAAVVLTKTINELYELASSPQMISTVEMQYDDKGRVHVYKDNGSISNNNDDYTSTISYHSLNNNIISVPKEIIVSIGSQEVRHRTTEVNPDTGSIISIQAYLDFSTISDTNMEYDQYGNLTFIMYPQNNNWQRMSYRYEYDDPNDPYHLNKYVISITDAFGYASSATYHPYFDKILSTTDLAGNKMIYRYDVFGRNTLILAPKEIEAGREYTIKFDYFPFYHDLPANSGVSYDPADPINSTFVPVARTKHYDWLRPDNDIETYTFIDGLARPIQIKKDIQYNRADPRDPDYIEALSFSGMTKYDEFGRGIEQFHPHFETKTSTTCFLFHDYASGYSSKTKYDELDRPVESIDPADKTSSMEYSIAQPNNGPMAIKTLSKVDQNGAQNIITETYKDSRGKVIATNNIGLNGNIWTQFNYNPIGELMDYKDAEGLVTKYKYDNFGRKISVDHPDNGKTTFTYDPASNLTQLQTANLASNGGNTIDYRYDFNRLVQIVYPVVNGAANLADVDYKYGSTGNQTGRLIWQKDATGTQDFDYGNMGEMIYNRRTIVGPTHNMPVRVFETTFAYDSFNRSKEMHYPDGEMVTYKYDLGGNLFSMTGDVNDYAYDYIKRIDYDEYEQRTYLLYGNKTETFYKYTPDLRRLENLMVKTSDSNDLYNNTYKYDFVGNVTSLNNSAGVTANEMAGGYRHNFEYDNLNRLYKADGNFSGSSAQANFGNDFASAYNLEMEYNITHGIVNKKQEHDKNGNNYAPNTYSNNYKYIGGTHKVETITDTSGSGTVENFDYDQNGNLIKKTDNNGNARRLYWDESNRLRVVNDNHDALQHYIYDASGERILKASSNLEAVWENGTILSPGTISINAYTTYPSAFLVINEHGVYSKHYYAGSQRIVSRIGDQAPDIFDYNNSQLKTSENKVDFKKIQQAQVADLNTILETAKLGKAKFIEYKAYKYEELQQAIADEDNTDTNRPATAAAPAPLPPLYFYHPDHLGTSTALTDFNGKAYQFFLNLPFGETMAEQHGTQYYQTPYKFNGKELDEETGLYYYGARYYDPKVSIWYSVDPLVEKLPFANPYNYCMDSPINAIDRDGRLVIFINGQHAGDGGRAEYWHGLDAKVMDQIGDHHSRYYDGAIGGWNNTISRIVYSTCSFFTSLRTLNLFSSARREAGMDMGYAQAKEIFDGLGKGETIKVVTHSMGSAYAKGFIQGLKKYAKENNINIAKKLEFEVDFAPFQPESQKAESGVKTIVEAHKGDGVAGCKPMPGAENHAVWDFANDCGTAQHSVDSFSEAEVKSYVPKSTHNKAGTSCIEQKPID